MDIIALKPPPGLWTGIDTGGYDHSPGNVITPEIARELRSLGYRWVARYTRPDGVVLDNPYPGGDWGGCYSLSIAENRWILEAGLGCVGLQFGTYGSIADYSTYGANAAKCSYLLGWPAGIHNHVDLEGGRHKASGARNIIAKAEAWAAANNNAGPLSAAYTTDILTGPQLYSIAGVTSYWGAGVEGMKAPMPRAFAIDQDPPRGDRPDVEMWLGDKMVCGLLVDTDTLRQDRHRDAPIVAATPEIAADWYGEAIGDLLSSPYLVA